MDESWLRALVAFPFGLAIGSFMTVVVVRVPEGQSVLRPRSRCPRCGTELRNRDNVPVVSWLLLGGRCRTCAERISVMYPLLELSTALLVAGAAATYDRPWIAVMVALFLALMPAITWIDIERRIIPNRITYPAFLGFAGYVALAWMFDGGTDPVRGLIGSLLYGGGLFLVALVSRGMGMGDVKLALVIGVVLGSIGLRYIGVAAAGAVLFGGVGGIVALAMGRNRKAMIPFGPYMAAGAVVAAFWGERIADWYLGSFGP
ncbi:MAG TPA: prepilin peptidase [Actinomycetota bacterium]|nr:prepilin peptidase [Actinomycetota bacterium]